MGNSAKHRMIDVALAFFGAAVGIGYQNLLQLSSDHPVYPYRVLCFLIALAIFLRFWAGAAVQLYRDHAQSSDQTGWFAWDLVTLVSSGVIACFVPYAPAVWNFFLLCLGFLAVGGVVWAIPCMVTAARRCACLPWLIMNTLHSFLLAAAALATGSNSGHAGDVRSDWLWIVLFASLLLLALDFAWQLVIIQKQG